MPPDHLAVALARALVDLAGPPEEDPDARRPDAEPLDAPSLDAERERAERLVAAGIRALGADAVTVLIVDDSGGPLVTAGSDDRVRALSGIELATGDGPALQCCRTGRRGLVEVAAVRDRWPAWAETAARHGWSLAESVPLRIRDHAVGAMVVLPGASLRPAEADLVCAAALAAVTASAVINLRTLAELRRRTDQLQAALTSRVVIEQAKGVLAERGGIDVQTAFDRMRRYARTHRQRLADVARQVVDGSIADAVLTHVRPLAGPGSILDL